MDEVICIKHETCPSKDCEHKYPHEKTKPEDAYNCCEWGECSFFNTKIRCVRMGGKL